MVLLAVSAAGVVVMSVLVGLGAQRASYPNGTGQGVASTYWDCCKVTCAWEGNTAPVSGAYKQQRLPRDEKPFGAVHIRVHIFTQGDDATNVLLRGILRKLRSCRA